MGMSSYHPESRGEKDLDRATHINSYAEKLLNNMKMSDCKPVMYVPLHADPSNHLIKAAEDKETVDQQSYIQVSSYWKSDVAIYI